MYLSITGVTADNRLAKYRGFENEADADAHASEYNGFVVQDPGGVQGLWVVDPVEKTVTRDVNAEQSADLARELEAIQGNRRAAYREEADHLHLEEERGEVPVGTWAAKVAEIKERFPKG
tara:strand:- start:694 stop:1053 length:360 start_codon:yes stop_codon:yes gene_type:complete